MARAQVMVQLTDELVELLDEEAGARRLSRSAVIRQVLEQHLAERQDLAIGRAIVEGYQRFPALAPDEWGARHAHGDVATRELLQRLDVEERAGGHQPW